MKLLTYNSNISTMKYQEIQAEDIQIGDILYKKDFAEIIISLIPFFPKTIGVITTKNRTHQILDIVFNKEYIILRDFEVKVNNLDITKSSLNNIQNIIKTIDNNNEFQINDKVQVTNTDLLYTTYIQKLFEMECNEVELAKYAYNQRMQSTDGIFVIVKILNNIVLIQDIQDTAYYLIHITGIKKIL